MECSTLNKLYVWCLKNHYDKNDHHPEHFNNPENEMPIIARMELTCDLLACVLGVYNKKNIPASLSECRFVIENEKWKNWKFALKEYLPMPSNNAFDRGERWIHFPHEEKIKLDKLFQEYKNGTCVEFIKDKLEKLNSVQYYLEDLHQHKRAIYEVWNQIPKFKVPEMKERIEKHDNDKFDTIMILGYTAKWCFNN